MVTEALTTEQIDREELAIEARAYLDAVDVFRTAGCAPVWQPESTERASGPSEGR